MKNWFCGIDPGQTGALGILGEQGEFIAAHRWRARDPRRLFDVLTLARDNIKVVYLEMVRVFSRVEEGFIRQNQSLLVNAGIWQGWLISLGLPFVLVDPATWQSAQGLFRWLQQFKKDPSSPTILTQAASRWPGAPFNTRPDDGVAAALLIAQLALQDHVRGIDRESLQLAVSEKKKVKKRKERAFKKPQDNLWPVDPPLF